MVDEQKNNQEAQRTEGVDWKAVATAAGGGFAVGFLAQYGLMVAGMAQKAITNNDAINRFNDTLDAHCTKVFPFLVSDARFFVIGSACAALAVIPAYMHQRSIQQDTPSGFADREAKKKEQSVMIAPETKRF
ncbi:MAG: hypothetical protein EAY76_00570 [Alphaproteobacteria bacterium]|nr:MAG: hypothetical protein EAY76_00570 [Alphaproteobacteria bacterium]TAF76078.1 MAG: hypothetical protein EAZ52_05130 [Alphaproteobacteria bacterium]